MAPVLTKVVHGCSFGFLRIVFLNCALAEERFNAAGTCACMRGFVGSACQDCTLATIPCFICICSNRQ